MKKTILSAALIIAVSAAFSQQTSDRALDRVDTLQKKSSFLVRTIDDQLAQALMTTFSSKIIGYKATQKKDWHGDSYKVYDIIVATADQQEVVEYLKRSNIL